MLLMSILRGARGGAVGWGRKVAGSIPDGVIGIFHRHNSSGRNMALGLTQPLTETSTRNIPVRRADNLTTFMCRLSWNLGASTSWNPQGLSRPVMGLLYLLPVQFRSLLMRPSELSIIFLVEYRTPSQFFPTDIQHHFYNIRYYIISGVEKLKISKSTDHYLCFCTVHVVIFILFKPTDALFLKHIHIHI